MTQSFFNPYNHGFVRVGVATPHVHVADVARNVEAVLALAKEAHDAHIGVLLYPELCLTAYALDDLHLQSAVQTAVLAALATLTEASAALMPVLVIGAPLRHKGRLFNCAVFVHRGKILGVVPKSYLPNEREFYEKRQFASGLHVVGEELALNGAIVPFGTDILLVTDDVPDCLIHAEICEDVWSPLPPSSFAALAGATVLLNLSASNALIGKSASRHALCQTQSSRLHAAYLYSAAGQGESTTDLAFDGQAMIYDNGALLAEGERFLSKPQLIMADIDLEALAQERQRQASFADSMASPAMMQIPAFRTVHFQLNPPRAQKLALKRVVPRYPQLQSLNAHNTKAFDDLCYEAYHIQASGLQQRLASSGLQKLVIGISGGLDSTHALLVACHAMERLGLPCTNVLAYTMPAFATSDKTRTQAWALMRVLGVTATEIDITPACTQMLKDLHHPAGAGDKLYNVTFENVQAGARTSLLFRLANQHNALVVGTGDLSELALGWCTYGVGDQMAHYNVNSGVSKTLIQALIRWVAETGAFGTDARQILLDILATDISPELVPAAKEYQAGRDKASKSTQPAQKTEDVIGPYALHDFFLHYASRLGYAPSKIAYLAEAAWSDVAHGLWPPHIEGAARKAYSLREIKHWLRVFVTRFYGQSQFKRSAMPNGPKVTSAGALSPRGDWRAPSDASDAVWLEDLERVPEEK